MKLLIKDATLAYEPAELVGSGLRLNNLKKFNIAIVDGLIKTVTIEKISGSFDQVISARKLILLPGIIDPHVHFRQPGFPEKENWFSGSQAAAKGGVTAVLDMPNTQPATVDQKAVKKKISLAKEKSIVNFGIYAGATSDNLSQLNKLKNIIGVKIYLGSSTGDLLLADEDILTKIFQTAKFLICVHAEEDARLQTRLKQFRRLSREKRQVSAKVSQQSQPLSELLTEGQLSTQARIHSLIRDPAAAARSVALVLKLVRQFKKPTYFCHISTEKEIQLIREAKQEGLPVFCEVTPHHLFLNVSDYNRLSNFAKVNPPLRQSTDQMALWQGIRDGTVDCIGSDHAPHTKAEKEQDYWQAPAGLPGVETMLPLLLQAVTAGRLTLARLAELTALNPAKIFSLANYGALKVGQLANLTLVDLNETRHIKESELLTRCGWSPFTGFKLTGWPVYTIINGQIAYQEGRVNQSVRGRLLSI